MLSVLFNIKDLLRFKRIMAQQKLQIKSKMLLHRKWASGRTWNSLEPYARVTGSFLEVGLSSSLPIVVQSLETGRGPGKIPTGFDKILYDWSIAKGIGFSSTKERLKFSRGLAFKIMRDGTAQFRAGRNTDIFTDTKPTYDKKITDMAIKAVHSKMIVKTKFL